jgi:hypothetical protein
MGWEEQQRNRILARAKQTETRIRERKKKLLRALIGAVVLGGSIILIDQATREKGALVPIDFKDQEGTVATWQRSGFVTSLDIPGANAVVDEAEWKKMAVGERRAVVMLLSSYCAAHNRKPEYRLTVKGNVFQKLLASVDDKRIVVK